MLTYIHQNVLYKNQLLLNNSLQIHQREIKVLETKLCPYLLK